MSKFSNQILVGIIVLLMVSIGITAVAYISSNRTITSLNKLVVNLNPARKQLDRLSGLIQETNLAFLQFTKLDYVHDAGLRRLIEMLEQHIQITENRKSPVPKLHQPALKLLRGLPEMLTRLIEAKPKSLSQTAEWQTLYKSLELSLSELRTEVRRIETEEQAASYAVVSTSVLARVERLLFDYNRQDYISAADIVMSVDEAGKVIDKFVDGAGESGLLRNSREIEQLRADLLRFKALVILFDDEVNLNVSGSNFHDLIRTASHARNAALQNLETLRSVVESHIAEIQSEEILKGQQRQHLLLIFAIIAVLIAGATAFFLRSIMRSNIDSVVQGTREISRGNLGFRLEENRIDEFQAISSAVNDMVKTLGETISALELAKADAAEAREKAEEANQMKSRFLANMSHEIRTPLNAIIGFSEVIKMQMFGRLDSPKYRQYASDIAASGTHLLSLINTILDLSKIEAGRLDLVDDELDVKQLIDVAVKSIEGHAVSKQIKLAKTVEENLPRLVGDMTAMLQILLNLLSNAVKYTDAGGTVTITATMEDGGGHQMMVSDTGVGIAPHDLDLVMKPFGQARNILTENEGGTGLGLSISQALVEQHDGCLKLESELGVGTKVVITFPANRVSTRD